MPKKNSDCYGLGLSKKVYGVYKETKIDNPISTGNRKLDKVIFNPVTENIPYVGSVIRGLDSYNKAYQAGGVAARAKIIYDDCKKQK